MCRFLAYSGPPTLMQELLLDSAHSLVAQSRHARMRFEPVNGDGFGVGWYPEHADPKPGTFVSIEPAWSNRNLRELAAKIRTRHFFAHVRDATPGMPVSQANCHPFQFGHYLWMHNGFLGEFARIRRALLAQLTDASFELIQGNTDTEHAFALFLDELNHNPQAHGEHLYAALLLTIERINLIRQTSGCESPAHMNFALSNGTTAVFTRYSASDDDPPTLHYLLQGDAVIVASEPLWEHGEWQEVSNGQALVLERDSGLEIRNLKI